MSDPAFGPNHAGVAAFLARLPSIAWLHSIGKPPDSRDAEFVGFDFVASCRQDRWAPWGRALPDAESAIERLELEHNRFAQHAAVVKAYKELQPVPRAALDALFLGVDRQFGGSSGYYADTLSYPHELAPDFPHRLVRGAVLEVMVADLDPTPSFFQNLMPWFERGRMPVGWTGEWPHGTILVW